MRVPRQAPRTRTRRCRKYTTSPARSAAKTPSRATDQGQPGAAQPAGLHQKFPEAPRRSLRIDSPQYALRFHQHLLGTDSVRPDSPSWDLRLQGPSCCHGPSGRLPECCTRGRMGIPADTAGFTAPWTSQTDRLAGFRNMGWTDVTSTIGSYPLSLPDGLVTAGLGRKATTAASAHTSTMTIQGKESPPQT